MLFMLFLGIGRSWIMDGFVIRTGGHVVEEKLANELLEFPKEDVLDELVSL